mmetsp:Transcript_33902/g.44720  ORF Transcript_33902/g.44720 Transcript_33902/m.44720 type:complete len:679 (-) Transcript_33902:322-2358(-)
MFWIIFWVFFIFCFSNALLVNSFILCPHNLRSKIPKTSKCGSRHLVLNANQTFKSRSKSQNDPSESPQPVVLTDWLEEDDEIEDIPTSHAQSSGGTLGYLRKPTSTPQRLKRIVKKLWDQLTSQGQLDYLPEEKRTAIKRALAVIAAFSSLNEHPSYNPRNLSNPFQAYQEADVNGDGELTFEEFSDWYGKSMDLGERYQKQTSSTISLLNQGASLKQIVEKSGYGLKKAYLQQKDSSLSQESLREAWLASDSQGPSVSSATESMQLAIEIAQVLIQMQADGDSIVASLLLSISEVPQFGLSHIGAQFGQSVQSILEDRIRLRSFTSPSFTSVDTMQAIYSGKGIKPLLDLDDTPAKMLREYLVQNSQDPRAFLVHLASLMGELRQQPHRSNLHRRQFVALEALQLYLPVAHAMGLGSKFVELEEQSYRAIFPDSYSAIAHWHSKVDIQGQILVANAKSMIIKRLKEYPELRRQIESIEIQGRTKTMVSVFKKVFRKNKSKNQVLDMVGLRVIITPKLPLAKEMHKVGSSNEVLDVEVTEEQNSIPSPGDAFENHEVFLPSVYTSTSYPPPYRHPESQVLHDVYDVIKSIWKERKGRYKNYVDFPKKNGYRSIHTTLVADSGLCFEVQLRSKEMHRQAEQSHKMYKGELHSREEALKFQAKLNKNPLLLPSSLSATDS